MIGGRWMSRDLHTAGMGYTGGVVADKRSHQGRAGLVGAREAEYVRKVDWSIYVNLV